MTLGIPGGSGPVGELTVGEPTEELMAVIEVVEAVRVVRVG